MGKGIIRVSPELIDAEHMDMINDAFQVTGQEYDPVDDAHILRCDSDLFTEADPNTKYDVEVTRSADGSLSVTGVLPVGVC